MAMIRNQPTSLQNRFILQQPYYAQNNFQQNLPQERRVIQEFNQKQIRPLPADSRSISQNNISQQNMSSPNLNVQELSQDLMKLKEQLKKLAQRGQEIGASRARAEEAQSARLRLQSSHQTSQFRVNMSSADQHQIRKKEVNSDLIYYPPTTSHPNHPFANNAKLSENSLKVVGQLPPSKRERIDSFMYSKEDKNTIIPISNPNKKELQKLSENHESDRITIELRLELEIKQLKQKINHLEQQLSTSQSEKENLAIELNSMRMSNEQLKQELENNRNQLSLASNSVSLEEFEREQRKASALIEKLQTQLSQIKSTNPRTSFDDILKNQLEENKLLKLRVDERNEEIQQLKDDRDNERKRTETLKGELTIQEMKASTQLRGKERKLQIQLNDKSNQLQTAKRALQTLDLKYKTSIKEIKQKDDFIMGYLVGRSKENEKEEIKNILDQYQIIFPQNRVMNDLLREQKEIEQLKIEVERLTHSQ